MNDDLRQRIADALTAAAHQCDGKCGLDERACYDAHPITWSAMAGGTTHIDGAVTAIANAVLAVVQPELDRALELDDVLADLYTEQRRTADALATIERVRALAADMRTWCSPHGIATDYAQRIDDALDGPEAGR